MITLESRIWRSERPYFKHHWLEALEEKKNRSSDQGVKTSDPCAVLAQLMAPRDSGLPSGT